METFEVSSQGFEVRLVPTTPYRTDLGWRRWWSHARYVTTWARLARRAVDTGVLTVPEVIMISMPPFLRDRGAAIFSQYLAATHFDEQKTYPALAIATTKWLAMGSVKGESDHKVARNGECKRRKRPRSVPQWGA